MSKEALDQTADWLYRLSDGLSDACEDAHAASHDQLTYLGFDFSFIFPSITARRRLDAQNPHDRFDLAARHVYQNLTAYRQEILGYKFVMNDFCLLKMLHHFDIQDEYIERLRDSEDIFQALKTRAGSGPFHNEDVPNADAFADALISIIESATSEDARSSLETFKQRLSTGAIAGIGNIFDKELIRRSWSDDASFKAAYSVISAFRHGSFGDQSSDDVEFHRVIDTLSLISTKQLAQNYQGRYRYLGWTKGRGFFGGNAARYYRLVLSPFYRMISLLQTPDADHLMQSSITALEDRRDQVRLYHKRVLSLSATGRTELSPVYVEAIGALRDDYIRLLDKGGMPMEHEKRRKLADSLSGNAKEAKEALAEASDASKRTLATLSDLARDFVDDELLSHYELSHNRRMRKIFDKLKLGS